MCDFFVMASKFFEKTAFLGRISAERQLLATMSPTTEEEPSSTPTKPGEWQTPSVAVAVTFTLIVLVGSMYLVYRLRRKRGPVWAARCPAPSVRVLSRSSESDDESHTKSEMSMKRGQDRGESLSVISTIKTPSTPSTPSAEGKTTMMSTLLSSFTPRKTEVTGYTNTKMMKSGMSGPPMKSFVKVMPTGKKTPTGGKKVACIGKKLAAKTV